MSQPIRILQVVTHMNRGGLETMLMNYYRHIDRRKVQFDFLVHRQERAAYDDEIEALGGRIYRLPQLVPWSVSYNKALNDFFAEHKEYRIIHVHQDCLSSVILKAAKKNGVPVRIAHSHSSNQDKNLKYIIKLIYKRAIPQYSTDLFACGQQAGDWMFGGAQFHVLRNAIDTGSYGFDLKSARKIRQEMNIPEDGFVIGHVGRFSPPKNHDFLIDIFSEVCKLRTDAYLLLVGDGELRTKIQEKVSLLGLNDRVIFTGIRSDVPALMQAMDVFAFPSLYEGLPVTLVEAQSAGLTCVISDNIPADCDLTELVNRLTLEASAQTWAKKLCALQGAGHKDTCREIARAGFDIGENARWLEQFYLQRWEIYCAS